jgi:PEGA domain-containing protein
VRAYKHITWRAALLAGVVLLGWPARAHGQPRGRVVPVHAARTQVVVVGGYYGGYYGGFYPPFWYDPWYGYPGPWGYPPPFPYHYYNVDPGASLRLEVKPEDAEVYVDGYYAGIVDDFDGVFQRLPVTPGEHTIELYLEGYRNVQQKVQASRRNTLKLKYTMEKLAPGEQQGSRPQPVNPPPEAAAPPPQLMPPQSVPVHRLPPSPPPPSDVPRSPEASAYGTLSIRVQPAEADVLIDGEKWRGPEPQDRLIVEVAEGRHTVQVQKPGYRAYVTDVQVRRGDTTTLNVSLRTQDER